MSIAPQEKKNETFKPNILKQTHLSVKKTVSIFFENPIHYLFYGSLTGLIIGLFFNTNFPLTLYFVVGFLGGLKLKQSYDKNSS